MANIQALDITNHRHLAVEPAKAELHGSELNLIPVVLSEFSHVATQNPIVITKNGDTGEFLFAAMYGFEQGENLLWENGRWQGLYLPLQIQRQPFFIGHNNDEVASSDNNLLICIDVDSPCVTQDTSAGSKTLNGSRLPLFDDAGKESDTIQTAKQCLAQMLQGEQHNQTLMAQLTAMDLIQPLSVEVTFENGQHSKLNGLYTINQDKLAALSSEQITTLHQQQLLQPIYAMINSLSQIYALIDRKNNIQVN